MDPTKTNTPSGCSLNNPFLEVRGNLDGMCSTIVNGVSYTVIDVATPPIRAAVPQVDLWDLSQRLYSRVSSQPSLPPAPSSAAPSKDSDLKPTPDLAPSTALVVKKNPCAEGHCKYNTHLNAISSEIKESKNINFINYLGREKYPVLEAIIHKTYKKNKCCCSFNLMKSLLTSNADPNQTSFYDTSPLFLAAAYGRFDYVNLLLEAKAKVNIWDPEPGLTIQDSSFPDDSFRFHHAINTMVQDKSVKMLQLLVDNGLRLPPSFQTIRELDPGHSPDYQENVIAVRASLDTVIGESIKERHLIQIITDCLFVAVPKDKQINQDTKKP